jgi:hypothetical protein
MINPSLIPFLSAATESPRDDAAGRIILEKYDIANPSSAINLLDQQR